MRIPEISRALSIDDKIEQRDRHSPDITTVSGDGAFDTKNVKRVLPSTLEKAATPTGKAFSFRNTKHVLIASPGHPSGADDLSLIHI